MMSSKFTRLSTTASSSLRGCLGSKTNIPSITTFSRGFASKSKKEDQNAGGKIKIEFKPFEVYRCDAPENFAYTDKAELLDFFTLMSRMRRMEVVSDQLYKQKLIRGFCHLYNGQEAVAAGMEAASLKTDPVITAYRDHGWMVARGASPAETLAELMMKATGCSRGKGGSMHMFHIPSFYGGHGIVGAQTPLGAGIAFALKYRGQKEVCWTYYGDGAANQGQLFEAYNMAKLWSLPCVFVCENNHYAMGTSTGRASADLNYFERAHFIPGIKVDGMNVLAVKKAGEFVADYVRSGKGPFVMEMDTYRYVGHSMSDPGTTYRTRDEVSAIRAERDPIEKVRHLLLQNNLATEEELKQIENAARKEMDDAMEFATKSPFPDDKEVFTHIYSKDVPTRSVETPTVVS
eukprot:TRINITY_DN3787_c0_g1_i1.p1 TRINITY_DN3787_c0_g1~~TRINITY_DN3787_c0_g1_i1.p1  ORF type:complete len:404 (-),score=80.30 TRINITY_DN3787_c0_g1_i1:122-1333(-)